MQKMNVCKHVTSKWLYFFLDISVSSFLFTENDMHKKWLKFTFKNKHCLQCAYIGTSISSTSGIFFIIIFFLIMRVVWKIKLNIFIFFNLLIEFPLHFKNLVWTLKKTISLSLFCPLVSGLVQVEKAEVIGSKKFNLLKCSCRVNYFISQVQIV